MSVEGGITRRLATRLAGVLVLSLATSALAATAVAPPAPEAKRAQSDGSKRAEDFRWSWHIRAGKAIEIKGVNGSIHAERAPGDRVEVVATRRARRSDPALVRIEFFEHEGGVTVCAVYPSGSGTPNECKAGGQGRMNTHNNDVVVDFEVRVPPEVRLVARTVNGGIEVEGLGGPVEARTVNGSVSVSTTGVARAATVNGSIRASIGASSWSEELAFTTVNGGITLAFPPRLSARVRAETVNGDISTDFPLTVEGRVHRRRLSGTVGNGGPGQLTLSSVNGNIRLEKSP
jgi:hypothetical protein